MFKFKLLIHFKMVGLATALLIIFSPHNAMCDQNGEEQREAVETVMKATYKQFGIEENINNYVKSLIPPKYQKYAEHVAPIAETISKKRLELKWEF